MRNRALPPASAAAERRGVPGNDFVLRHGPDGDPPLRLGGRLERGLRQRLLLMQRSDNFAWGLPGGYVEIGESVAAAAAREVREETGVEIELGRLVGVYSDPARQVIAYPDGRRVQAVNLCFEARPIGASTPTTPDEALASGYFAAAELPTPLVPIHEIRIQDALAGDPAARIR